MSRLIPMPLRSNHPDIERPLRNGKPAPANWSHVPKNKRAKVGKAKRINKWVHMHEMRVGIGSPFTYLLDDSPMSDEDMWASMGVSMEDTSHLPTDPLLAMLF